MSGQVIWITGLSGAGKTTLANELTARLQQYGLQPILLDGDMLRTLLKVPHNTIDAHNRESRIKLALKYAQICSNVRVSIVPRLYGCHCDYLNV